MVGKAACRNIRIFSNTNIATVFVSKTADFSCQIALYVHGRSGIQHIICYDDAVIACMDAAHILIDKTAGSDLAVAVKIDICCSIGYGAFTIKLQILTCHEGSIGIGNIHTTYLHGLACKHGGFIVVHGCIYFYIHILCCRDKGISFIYNTSCSDSGICT